MTDLLLIHAFPLDAAMWDEQDASLSAEHRVVRPNLPGFGGEPLAGEILTIEAMADAAVAALDRAGVARAVVAGCSMGGYAAFDIFRRYRDRVAGLVLVDTRAEPDDDAGREKRRALAEKVLAEGTGVVADAPPPLLSGAAPEPMWDRVREMIRRQPAEAIAAASLGMGQRPDSVPLLGEIDVPTLVVVGTEDALTPPELSHTIAKGIDDALLVEIEGAGHLSNIEDPDAFGQALDRFFADL